MVHYYSIDWKKKKTVCLDLGKRKWEKNDNIITILIKCLDEHGQVCYIEKKYEDWVGVCTHNIERVVQNIKLCFPNCNVRYERLGHSLFSKVLPYFEKRLQTGKLNYAEKPFYKLYSEACCEDVGQFLNKKYKYGYYEVSDWLVRIYLDLCTRYQTESGFYYRWYDVDMNNNNLLESFNMLLAVNDVPRWKIASFDLETVCTAANGKDRVPTGSDPQDKIVMISIIKWDNSVVPSFKEERVLYLDPRGLEEEKKNIKEGNDSRYIEFQSEAKMIQYFHAWVQECHILTGYNINKFDFPCLFARILWLDMRKLLPLYTSQMVGSSLVTTFMNKIVIDAYSYFHTFSNYDLSGFKLDNVAKIKLGLKEGKVPVDSRGLYAWYSSNNRVTSELCLSRDRKHCYEVLKPPKHVPADRFGTFGDYLQYALQDAILVYKLFNKEMILDFLVARANFAAGDIVKALHYGNSRFLVDIFKTYGTRLGFYINIKFFKNLTDGSKFKSLFVGETYQGALNYCVPETHYSNVSVLDFVSMYPVSLLSVKLDYGNSTILTAAEYARLPTETKDGLTTIPYRVHSEMDFTTTTTTTNNNNNNNTEEWYQYPAFDPQTDTFVIVVNQKVRAFLPSLVEHFLTQRKYHQRMFKETKDIMHYNIQLCIKIMINSMYGIMASKNSPLAKLTIAMTIVTLARYQILGSYHYVQRHKGLAVCYVDTDSLMVQNWPTDHCDEINRYLSRLPYVEIKFEQRMKQMLVLSKKRYVYETADSKYETKGFQKKVNDLIRFMSDEFIHAVMTLNGSRGDPSDGWILWVKTLERAYYMCRRDPKRYSITRKTKKMDEYKSTSCASYKLLQKYPEKENEYIEYTYSRADVATTAASRWIMDVNDCRNVDFTQLFIGQKRVFCTLLNWCYWQLPNPHRLCWMVLNTMRWKCFVHAELLNRVVTKKNLLLLVERGVKYTFEINDHSANSRRGKILRE